MPYAPSSIAELEESLSEPRDATVEALERVDGDILVLGAGGKMGPTLARMAARAIQRAPEAAKRQVIAVSRFSHKGAEDALRSAGVSTIRCDLLDREAVARLPDAPNVIYMAGQKFGTRDAPSTTWMLNVVAPAICAERYRTSRIVAFSTGNVYPLVPVTRGGATELQQTAPVGEYAASCLGRERVFEHFSASAGTRVAIVRLNYAIDLRYGVLTDLATAVAHGRPVALAMGHVNVIWQRDANRAALELLPRASAPPLIVNVTGAETLSVREIAWKLAQRLGRDPLFEGAESPDALLSNNARMQALVGAPEMGVETMLDWVATWVRDGMPLLGKPTHFETRDGAF